jgi:osmoprotectant transport system permease protein
LNLLSGKITDSIMTDLNYKVDQLKQSPERVAMDFMVAHALYKSPRLGNKGVIRIGSKIFGEQYILAQMYRILISGNTDLSVQTKTGLGGTKICFDAYTGTGFLVLLKPSSATVHDLIASREAVYGYVRTEFSRLYQLKWLRPIGFNNTYALMMREEQARRMGIRSITDLVRVVDAPAQ